MNPNAINDHLKMSLEDSDTWEIFKNPTIPVERIEEELCGKDVKWNIKKVSQKKNWFPRSFLKEDCKFWNGFINARLQPTSNVSQVYMERAMILYQFMTGNVINVGDMIFKEMHGTVTKHREALKVSLFHH